MWLTNPTRFTSAHLVILAKLQFIIEQDENDYNKLNFKYSLFRPDFPMTNWIPQGASTDITVVSGAFEDWLSDVVSKYLESASIPDQWTELRNVQPMISSKSFTKEDLEAFTDTEKKQIEDSLSKFQQLIQEEMSPVKEQLDYIQEKLDYLDAAVDRLNRFDWKGVALSTVMGIATNLSIDTNTGKQIFDLFQQAFRSAIQFLPK